VSLITCGFCGHPGPHATITTDDGTTVCTGCDLCYPVEQPREVRFAD